MRDAGVLANNSIPGGGDDNPNAEKAFFNAKTVASIFDASAALGVAKSTAPEFTSFVSIAVPAAKDATQKARGLAKTGKCAAVNPKGDHAKEALAFIKWLTQPEQQKAFQEGAGTLPTAASLSSGSVSAQAKGFSDAAANAMIVPSTMTTDVLGAISKGAQSIVLKEKSVDDVLKSVQAAQQAKK
jgi:ABC-type glycerol-3-phosphate transport system substrate-binding protein